MRWYRTVEETIEVSGEIILQYWRIRLMPKWNMNHIMSEGKHNNNVIIPLTPISSVQYSIQ